MGRIVLGEVEGDEAEKDRATREFGRVLAETQALADLLGRSRLFAEIDEDEEVQAGRAIRVDLPTVDIRFDYGAAPEEVRAWARTRSPLADGLPFDEAVDDLISREPRLARSAKLVRKVYSREHGFALAKSTSLEVTKKIQRLLFDGLARGEAPERTREKIERLGFSRAYAATVYRTNVSTAYAAGRFAQAFDPDVGAIVAGFRFTTSRDPDVRPNHAVAEGIIAGQDDPIWDWISPPLGYNCRCSLAIVTKAEARRLGLLRKDGFMRKARARMGAQADEGFGKVFGRPDRAIYGGRR